MRGWLLWTPSPSPFPFAMNISPLVLPRGFQRDSPSEDPCWEFISTLLPHPVPLPLALKNGPPFVPCRPS